MDPLEPSLTADPTANPSATCLGAHAEDEGVAESWRCSAEKGAAEDDDEADIETIWTGAESTGGPADMLASWWALPLRAPLEGFCQEEERPNQGLESSFKKFPGRNCTCRISTGGKKSPGFGTMSN